MCSRRDMITVEC